MEERNAGTDCECGLGEREGELAEVFYAEGFGEFGVVAGKTDLFEGFAASYFEGCFVECVCFTAWERCLSFCSLAESKV
jgi:hypothetical protein